MQVSPVTPQPHSAPPTFCFLKRIESNGFLTPASREDLIRVFDSVSERVNLLVKREFYEKVYTHNAPNPPRIIQKAEAIEIVRKTDSEALNLAVSVFSELLRCTQATARSLGIIGAMTEGFRSVVEKAHIQNVVSTFGQEVNETLYGFREIESNRVPLLFRRLWEAPPERKESFGRQVEVYKLPPWNAKAGIEIRQRIAALQSGQYFDEMMQKYSIPPGEIARVRVYFSFVQELVQNALNSIPQLTLIFQDTKDQYTISEGSPLNKSENEINADVVAYIASDLFFHQSNTDTIHPCCLATDCLEIARQPTAQNSRLITLDYLRQNAALHEKFLEYVRRVGHFTIETIL